MENQFELVGHLQIRHIRFIVNRIAYRQMHVHSDFELAMLLEGNGLLKTAAEKIPMVPGDIVFVNSYESHGYLAAEEKEVHPVFLIAQISSHFLMDYYSPIRNTLFTTGDLKRFFDDQSLSLFRNLFLKAGREYFGKEEGFQLRIISDLASLLSMLLEKVPHRLVSEEEKNRMKRRFDRIQRILSYVDENYSGKIRLADIATKEGITLPHLSHIFTETFGVTFQQYVQSKRMQKAIRLMQDSTKTLTNIAFECGFSDPKYMNRLFRQSFSCRPRQYREKGKKGMLEASFLPSVQKEEFLSDDLAMGKIKGYIEKKNPTC